MHTMGRFSRLQIDEIFLFSQKIGFEHFIQIVSCGENLHEMSNLIFLEKIRKKYAQSIIRAFAVHSYII